jgi:cyclic 2,3-diphosphoglycerate synthetase
VRAVAIVDGEHYEPVVRDALAGLPYEVVAAVLVGGTEKLRGGEDYGVPLAASVEEAVLSYEPDLVVDLSDEPVLGPRERMLLASRVLALGLAYEGADFRFDVPLYAPFPLPSLAVIGTGKRVGKTAVTTHLARLLARERELIVVAMGRGGPPEPELVETAPRLDDLLALSRAGRHPASDHLEIAALAGVVTVGCRRCGGGLAGAVASSNVLQGAALAAEREPDLVLFDGSGAAIPPVAVDRRVLVVGPGQDATAYLNAYRVLVSDLAVLVGGDVRAARRIRELKEIPVVGVTLRLRPTEPLRGRATAVFATGAARTDELDAHVVHVSRSLADRPRLREELRRVDAEVFLVELKAAAIDVVAEVALERGAEVVFAGYDVQPLPGEPDLDAELLALADAATGVRA